MTAPLWCEACGEIAVAVYPCKFVFHDRRELPFNICPDCMKHGKLVIDLPRKNLISIVLTNLNAKAKWIKRGLNEK